jgi:hypothetical protein
MVANQRCCNAARTERAAAHDTMGKCIDLLHCCDSLRRRELVRVCPSDESVADAKVPLRVRWRNDSYVNIPFWN